LLQNAKIIVLFCDHTFDVSVSRENHFQNNADQNVVEEKHVKLAQFKNKVLEVSSFQNSEPKPRRVEYNGAIHQVRNDHRSGVTSFAGLDALQVGDQV
jgi:hypothetical protein